MRASDLTEARFTSGSSSGSEVLPLVGLSYDLAVYDANNVERVIKKVVRDGIDPRFSLLDEDGVRVSVWMPIECGKHGSSYRFHEALPGQGLLFYTWGNYGRWGSALDPELTIEFKYTTAPGFRDP